jgi:hypothetical protein
MVRNITNAAFEKVLEPLGGLLSTLEAHLTSPQAEECLLSTVIGALAGRWGPQIAYAVRACVCVC